MQPHALIYKDRFVDGKLKGLPLSDAILKAVWWDSDSPMTGQLIIAKVGVALLPAHTHAHTHTHTHTSFA